MPLYPHGYSAPTNFTFWVFLDISLFCLLPLYPALVIWGCYEPCDGMICKAMPSWKLYWFSQLEACCRCGDSVSELLQKRVCRSICIFPYPGYRHTPDSWNIRNLSSSLFRSHSKQAQYLLEYWQMAGHMAAACAYFCNWHTAYGLLLYMGSFSDQMACSHVGCA